MVIGSAWNTSPLPGSLDTACASSAAPAGVNTVGVADATDEVTPSGNNNAAAAASSSHGSRHLDPARAAPGARLGVVGTRRC
ncbi:hypothetical protein [Actinomycetospora chiangmaiensis]|uniref:hypothetical protein n=1 Tax=Actinomycetospora chiangmaiensis TaxID=402650 RepID=UPI000370DAB5|nr:hypothetical protein [Actinomycetospora chiangmaiensis]